MHWGSSAFLYISWLVWKCDISFGQTNSKSLSIHIAFMTTQHIIPSVNICNSTPGFNSVWRQFLSHSGWTQVYMFYPVLSTCTFNCWCCVFCVSAGHLRDGHCSVKRLWTHTLQCNCCCLFIFSFYCLGLVCFFLFFSFFFFFFGGGILFCCCFLGGAVVSVCASGLEEWFLVF